MNLDAKIEAILFYKTEPIAQTELCSVLGVSAEELTPALQTLSVRLENGATRLLLHNDTVQLVSAPEASDLIEKLRADELSREIGRAGAETLAIVLYRGPLTRAEIDFIRGVNSSFILRNLQIRGLIERKTHTKDARSFQYAVTGDLLAHLGITRKEDLPDFASVADELDAYARETAHTK